MNHHANNARRRFLRHAGVIALLTCATPWPLVPRLPSLRMPAMPPHPLVPFTTTLGAWDHHWFLWLPHHPIYELVEVASREPESDGRVVVWVWFTERAGAKRQIHYRNDAVLAAVIGGNYCPIGFQIAGDDGRPRGLEVRFDDIENRPVEIDVAFDPDQTLGRQGAGLTDQSGHMSDGAFMIFHRDSNALARYGRASIANTNYAFGSDEPPRRISLPVGVQPRHFHRPHSLQFLHGEVRSGRICAVARDRRLVCDAPARRRQLLAAGRPERTARGIRRARRTGQFHSCGFRSCRCRPAVVTTLRQSSSFSISIKAAADLVQGRVETRCDDRACVLDWHPSAPLWASKHRSDPKSRDRTTDSVSVAVRPAS